MTDAIRYHRYSSKKQDRGSSLERQRLLTQALCDQNHWIVIDTIEDAGQSAWKGDHLSAGKLGELRKRIDAGLIASGTMLVVENLDRLSRQDYRTARRWIEDVTDRGITVAVCNPALTLDSAAMNGANIGAMIQHLLEANRATAESARKSEFQKKNLARMLDMIRAGIAPTPRVPKWLEVEVGQPVRVIEERAALVRLIYEWSASGMGLQSICQKLNAEFETWTGAGWKSGQDQWRIGYVRDILVLPPAEGKYVVWEDDKPTGEIITGFYPRVVDADLVVRARAAMLSRRGTGGANRAEAANLVQGLVTCTHCGGAVGRVSTGRTERAHAYLVCRNSRYGTCDNRSGMPYTVLIKVVVDHLLHLALDDTHFAAIDDIAPLVAKTATIKSAIEVLQTQQDNMLQVLLKMPSSVAIMGELERIEADMAKARADLEEAEEDVERARGRVSPAEHLNRVKAVKDSLATDAEARRKVRDALPSLIQHMKWDGEKMAVSSTHMWLTISRTGEIFGFDLFHPKHGPEADPEYTRRRDRAKKDGSFPPI